MRTHRLAMGLSDAFEVTVVALLHAPRSGEQHGSLEELRALLPDAAVVTVPGRTRPKRVDQLLSVPRVRSWEWGRYRVRDLTPTVARHSSGAIVHVDDLGAAGALDVDSLLAAFAPHNVEHAIVRAAAAAGRGPRRVFNEIDARKVEREERRAWKDADLCVAVSDLDAETMADGGARRVAVAPNGTDPVDQLRLRRWRRGEEPLRLLFVGTGSYQPNARGVAWFVREVMPLFDAEGDVILDVVGSPPLERVDRPGVHYAGRVDEVESWYERAHIAVVPLFEGSGTRLKLVEAMALGRPVVSTRVGAEGLPVAPQDHYALADEAREFADAIRAVADDLAAADDSPTAARVVRARSVATTLFWPEIASRLAETYREAVDAMGDRPT